MRDFRAILYREFKLLTGNRTNLLLSLTAVLVYIVLFATSMTQLVPRVIYEGTEVRYIDFALPALLVFSMVSAATTTATSLFQERLGGMDIELWSCPVRKSSYVAAKVAAATSMVLVQTTLALALALTMFRLTWPLRHLPAVALAALVSAGALTGGYLLIATLIRSFQRFTIIANVLGLIMLFASASFYPANSMPLAVRWLSVVNPMTYAIRAVRDAALFGADTTYARQVSVGLLLFAISSWIVVARGLVRRARSL